MNFWLDVYRKQSGEITGGAKANKNQKSRTWIPKLPKKHYVPLFFQSQGWRKTLTISWNCKVKNPFIVQSKKNIIIGIKLVMTLWYQATTSSCVKNTKFKNCSSLKGHLRPVRGVREWREHDNSCVIYRHIGPFAKPPYLRILNQTSDSLFLETVLQQHLQAQK